MIVKRRKKMMNRYCLFLLLLSFQLMDFTFAFTSPAATRTCCLNAATTSRRSTFRKYSPPQQLKSNGQSLQMQPSTANCVSDNNEPKV